MPRAAPRRVGVEVRGERADEIRDLFLSMRPGLARAVSGIVPPHEVEDIVQETCVRLCQVAKPSRSRSAWRAICGHPGDRRAPRSGLRAPTHTLVAVASMATLSSAFRIS